MGKAFAYIRVSREDENPQNQINSIREWASKNNIEILGFYIDYDVSGAIPPRERPNYRAMLDAARALGIKLLLFYDLSRLSRSLEDGLNELKNLAEEGFEFKFVAQEFLDYIQDPLLKKKVISDFLWFAELYREDIRRRTIEALKRAKKEGKKLGRPSYPIPIEEVRKILKQGYSIAEIHRILTLQNKICRNVNGKTKCMSYEAFRRKIKTLL